MADLLRGGTPLLRQDLTVIASYLTRAQLEAGLAERWVNAPQDRRTTFRFAYDRAPTLALRWLQDPQLDPAVQYVLMRKGISRLAVIHDFQDFREVADGYGRRLCIRGNALRPFPVQILPLVQARGAHALRQIVEGIGGGADGDTRSLHRKHNLVA